MLGMPARVKRNPATTKVVTGNSFLTRYVVCRETAVFYTRERGLARCEALKGPYGGP